jgi:hypothetical protein
MNGYPHGSQALPECVVREYRTEMEPSGGQKDTLVLLVAAGAHEIMRYRRSLISASNS